VAKVIPSSYALPSLSDAQIQAPILSSTYRALLNANNALFGNAGVSLGGRCSVSSAALVRFTGVSFTQIGAATGGADRDALLAWNGLARGWRYLLDADDELSVEVEVYAQDLEIRWQSFAGDSFAALNKSATFSVVGPGYGRQRLTFSTAESTLAGAPRAIAFWLDARPLSPATEGFLWGWTARERILRPGDEALLP